MVDPELPQVRIGDCWCVLLADARPVGYRCKLTALGEVGVPVYAYSITPTPNGGGRQRAHVVSACVRTFDTSRDF